MMDSGPASGLRHGDQTPVTPWINDRVAKATVSARKRHRAPTAG